MIHGIWKHLRRFASRRERQGKLSWSTRMPLNDARTTRLLVESLEHRELLSVTPVGGEFLVNTYTTSNQERPGVASDASGNYVVVWNSWSQDGSGYGIFAQRYNSAGVPQGSEFGVNSYTTINQGTPSVAMNALGGFVVAWSSYNQTSDLEEIFARRFDSTGAPQGTEFRVNTYTTNSQMFPSVAMDGDGDFVVTWESSIQDASTQGIYGQRFNAAGVAQGSEFRVNSYRTGTQSSSSVSMGANGDFVVAWDSSVQDGSYGIYAQRYNAAGVLQGTEFRVNTWTTSHQRTPSVAVDHDGNFVVAWQSQSQDGSAEGIYAQRYSSSGASIGSEFRVNTWTTDEQNFPQVAVASQGGFVVAWNSERDGSGEGVYAQAYDQDAAPLGGEFRVNLFTTGDQRRPAISMDPDGDFVIAWQSEGQDGNGRAVYAQQYCLSTRVTEVRVTGENSAIDEGERLVTTVPAGASLQVTFNAPMSQTGGAGGANSVTNPANWSVTKNGLDISSQISSIGYTGNVATLTLASALTSGKYALTAKDSSSDSDGNSLDGDANGVAGGNFTRNFEISPPVAMGSEFPVNTYTTGSQIQSTIALDDNGNYVIVWNSDTQDGDSFGIFAQRYQADGTQLGSEFQVNSYTTGIQTLPRISVDADGDFVIVWSSGVQDAGTSGIYAQRYNSSGVRQGSEFRVNSFTTGSQSGPTVSMDANGNFVVAWESSVQDSGGFGIYAQRYNAAGTPQGSEFRVNTYTTGTQRIPSVSMDSDGDFVVVWQSPNDGSVYGIYGQRFGSAGNQLGTEFQVNTYTTNSQNSPEVSVDSDGNFVVVWNSSGQDGSAFGVFAQRFNSIGVAQGSEFRVNDYTTSDQLAGKVSSDHDGDFVVVWHSSNQDGSLFGVYAKRYSSGGVAQGSEFRVNTYTTNHQGTPAISLDYVGDFVVAWSSAGQDGPGIANSTYAQRYSLLPTGTTIADLDGSNNLVISDAASGGQNDTLTIKSDATNSVFIISDPNNLLGSSIGNATGSGTHTLTIPFAAVSGPQISVFTLAGNDSLTVDFSLGNFSKSIVYDGGTQTTSDSLTLTGGGSFAAVTHTFTNASSGSVSVTGNALISYSGLEPITDNLAAIDRIFTFNGGAETISLVDAAGANMTIDSTLGESVTFANPTGSLTINAGSGDDAISVNSVDAAIAAAVAMNGDAGNDTIQLNADLLLAAGRNLSLAAETVTIGSNTDVATTGNGTITITADNLSIASNATVSAAANTLTIVPQTAARQISLGNETAGQLSLTNLELSRLAAGTVQIGDSASGIITVNNSLTPGNSLSLTTGANLTINHPITMAAGKNLTASAVSTINLPNTTSDLALSGGGDISLTTSRNIILSSSSSITAVDGDIALTANQQSTPTSGNFTGILVSNASILLTGNGNLTLVGRGGDDAGGSQRGLFLSSGTVVQGGNSGAVIVNGTGGNSTGAFNVGINMFSANAQITSTGAAVTVTGIGGGTGASQSNYGLDIDNNQTKITSSGPTASVTVYGYGGSGSGGNHHGIILNGNAQISASGGPVRVEGTGGSAGTWGSGGISISSGASITNSGTGPEATVTVIGTGQVNGNGVYVVSASAGITSSGGNVTVEGTGGNGQSSGVFLQSSSRIASGGPTSITTVKGIATDPTGTLNYGVGIHDSLITSGGGDVLVTGISAGGTNNHAIRAYSSGGVSTATNGGNITLIGDSMDLTTAVSADANHRVTLLPYTDGVSIGLGNTTNPFGGPLSLSNTELNNITAGSIHIGNSTTGPISITAALAHTTPSNFVLTSSGNISFTSGSLNTGGGNLSLNPGMMRSVQPTFTGTDITTGNATLKFGAGATLQFTIDGPTVNTQYRQLNIAGQVDLTGVNLFFGGNYTPLPSQTFTIIDNDGADPIIGTFGGYAEGASVNVNGVTRVITYLGGSGNDVVLLDTILQVTSITPTPTGFIAQFNHAFEPSTLNLYDEDGAQGPADVKLIDSALQEIRGSVLIDPSNRKLTFIKSGGVLPAGNYTVQLMSGANAFRLPGGRLLDGNSNGDTGDNYSGNITITSPAPTAITLGIPDLVRGYGQAVNVPVSSAGLPISISNAQGIKSATFTLNYDPTLLSIAGATPGMGIIGDVTLDTSVPGVAQISVTSTNGLSSTAGLQTLVNLTASVPSNAPYGKKHLLDLANLQILDTSSASLPAIDNDGIHIAAYFGDANGSQTYNAPDATLAQRLIVGSISGFDAYQLADPYLIADITGNGQVQSDDVTQIQRAIVGLPTPEIPADPGLAPAPSGGPDPIVSIPQNLTASVGQTVTVPVELLVTEPTGITLAGADLAIAYDASTLELTDADVGQLLVGFGLSVNATTPGVIRLSLAGSPLDLDYNASSVLAALRFTVIAGAGTTSNINLLQSSASLHTALYDAAGRPMTLSPAPTNAADDAVDGRLTIEPSARLEVIDALFASEDLSADSDWI